MLPRDSLAGEGVSGGVAFGSLVRVSLALTPSCDQYEPQSLNLYEHCLNPQKNDKYLASLAALLLLTYQNHKKMAVNSKTYPFHDMVTTFTLQTTFESLEHASEHCKICQRACLKDSSLYIFRFSYFSKNELTLPGHMVSEHVPRERRERKTQKTYVFIVTPCKSC